MVQSRKSPSSWCPRGKKLLLIFFVFPLGEQKYVSDRSRERNTLTLLTQSTQKEQNQRWFLISESKISFTRAAELIRVHQWASGGFTRWFKPSYSEENVFYCDSVPHTSSCCRNTHRSSGLICSWKQSFAAKTISGYTLNSTIASGIHFLTFIFVL